MPLDAICLQAVVEELRPQLLGLRIDKVQQPARDQVILLLRGRRLLLNAGASASRIQLTETVRDNPAEPPMFCMLLRKHLTGAKIADLTQPPMERMVRLELDEEAQVDILIQFDSDGVWRLVRSLDAHAKRSWYLPIVPRRCDHFRLRMEGAGGCRVYSLTREVYSGSELRGDGA